MTKEKRKLWLIGACSIALVLASGLITLSVLGSGPSSDIPPPSLPPELIRGTEIGSTSAPVVIEEYSDFQCSFCAKFAREILPALEREFIKTGKLRLVFHHFPIYGQESVWAAQASLAAADQGKFWEYHNLLYSNYVKPDNGDFALERLKSYARELGLDENQFNTALDTEKYLPQVLDDLARGLDLGINKTPTFVFVNGRQLAGTVSISDFRRLIMTLLESQ